MHDAHASRAGETSVPLTASAVLVNNGRSACAAVGEAHAAAKSFAATIEFALAADGPWTDAKSPVKVMRVKAPQGATLHFRVAGPDGRRRSRRCWRWCMTVSARPEAVTEIHLTGRAASPGLAIGPVTVLRPPCQSATASGDPAQEAAALKAAIAGATAELAN